MCNQSGLLLVAVGMSVLSVAATIAFQALPMYSMLSVRAFPPPIPPLRGVGKRPRSHTPFFPPSLNHRPFQVVRGTSVIDPPLPTAIALQFFAQQVGFVDPSSGSPYSTPIPYASSTTEIQLAGGGGSYCFINIAAGAVNACYALVPVANAAQQVGAFFCLFAPRPRSSLSLRGPMPPHALPHLICLQVRRASGWAPSLFLRCCVRLWARLRRRARAQRQPSRPALCRRRRCWRRRSPSYSSARLRVCAAPQHFRWRSR